jgi:hypothetical protein
MSHTNQDSTGGSVAHGSGRWKRSRWIAGSLAIVTGAAGIVAVNAPVASAEESAVFGEQPTLAAWYSAPAGPKGDTAAAWEKESIPLGNGFIGAGIMGGVDSDEIIINDHTYWSGGPGQNPAYDGGFSAKTSDENVANLRRAQELVQSSWNETTPASVDENGNITPATTPNAAKMAEIADTVNQLVGDKRNFGSYRQLSSIVINADEPIGISGFSANYENPNDDGETTGSLFDGSTGTKMFADLFGAPTVARPYEVEWSYTKAFGASTYRLATGNDTPSRDFKSWKLYA